MGIAQPHAPRQSPYCHSGGAFMIHTPNRRGLLAAGGLLGASLMLPRGSFAQATDAIADTTSGKGKGVALTGVKQFKGIPHGADTGGKNRFMPPQKVTPWTGVRDALNFGPTAPQAKGAN